MATADHALTRGYRAASKMLGSVASNLPAELTLMAKLLVLCLWIKGMPFALPEPFVPFHPLFDELGRLGVFRPAMMATFTLGSVLVFCSRRVREGCLLVGVALLLALLSSKAFYTNGKVFWACLLILLGLQRIGSAHWLRLQLVVVYFGSAFSKVMDPDWRSGRFFESWMHVRLEHDLYAAAAAMLPAGVLSWCVCWMVIITEAALSVLLLRRRWLRVAVWAAILFHAGLLFVLWGDSFGHFYYGAMIALLACTPWPEGAMVVRREPGGRAARVFAALRFVDWDRRLRLRRGRARDGLEVEYGGAVLRGFAAAKCVVLHTPFFYYALLGAVLVTRAVGRPLVVAAVIALFLPLAQGFWSRRLSGRLGRGRSEIVGVS